MVTDPGLAPVWVDARHLQTALLNLAINARDAMPSGGVCGSRRSATAAVMRAGWQALAPSRGARGQA